MIVCSPPLPAAAYRSLCSFKLFDVRALSHRIKIKQEGMSLEFFSMENSSFGLRAECGGAVFAYLKNAGLFLFDSSGNITEAARLSAEAGRLCRENGAKRLLLTRPVSDGEHKRRRDSISGRMDSKRNAVLYYLA